MQSDAGHTRILQQCSQTNPIEENRHSTNSRYIVLFILVILVWIYGLLILRYTVDNPAFALGSTHKLHNGLLNNEDDIFFVLYRCVNATLPYLSPDMETFGKVFLFSLFFGGMSVFGCIILIRLFTKPFVCISLLIFVMGLVIGFVSTIIVLNLVISISATFLVVYAITVLFCVKKVGLNSLCKLVRNSTRAIIDCPVILFFTFVIVALETLTLIFAVKSLKLSLALNGDAFWIVTFILVVVIAGMIISAFIILFAMAVISEYTVNWYWIADKKEISSRLILKSFTTIFRNHIGTIALQSTLIIPFIYAVIRAIKYRNKSERPRHSDDIYVESVAKVALVPTIQHTALIHTSIYGSNFVISTKKTFKLVIDNAALYLATIEIFNMLAVIGLIGNTIVMFFTAYGIVRIEHIPVHNMPLPFIWGFYFPVAAYCILMISVGRAMLMNNMIILNAERDPEVAF